MPQLDPTFFASQLFWLAVSFVVLYVALSRFLLPPLLEIIERRRQTVEGDISRAQDMKAQAELAREQYEKTLSEARGRAQELVNNAMLEHKAKAEAQGREMDRQVEEKLNQAARRIAAKKDELIAALTPTAAEITAMIVEKLTHQQPSHEQVHRIIDELSKGRR